MTIKMKGYGVMGTAGSSSKNMMIRDLEEKARVIRVRILQMIHSAPTDHPGHPGGSLSAADIVAALYFGIMKVEPKNPEWPERDRFVLSKGHGVPVVYAALAEKGYFPRSLLSTLRQPGSILQGHPDMKKTPGLDMTTGSLGQGLSAAAGMAIAGKIDKKSYSVFALLSDGELDEGQIWEAVMTAAKYRLDNLIAIVDWNGIQNDGPVDQIMPLGDLAGKWRSFGWETKEINGHRMREIHDALKIFQEQKRSKPKVILAHTVKGKGVSFMENQLPWHAKPITDEELSRALDELHWSGGGLND
jgi:transketolase